MKKLALLLGSLLVVGVAQAKEVVVAPVVVEESKEIVVVAEPVVEEVAVVVEEAKPVLRVTQIGQWIEIDNYAGSADGDIGDVMLGNRVALSTDNWDFEVNAKKSWITDTKDGFGKTGSEINLDAWRNFSTEAGSKYALGARWRQTNNYDRYYLRGKYVTGMFSGWADVWYEAGENNNDEFKTELMPANVTMGPLTLGYFLAANKGVGSNANNGQEHQLRAYLPLYVGEKLALGAEYRFGLEKQENGKVIYEFARMNRAQLGLGYQYTENLEFSTYYLYEITEKKDSTKDYYGEFGLAWNYSF